MSSHVSGLDGSRLPAWRRHTASGVLVTAVALGLRAALEPPAEEARVVVDAAGEPLSPTDPLELHFDPDDPSDTWVIVRPWLLGPGP
jgi:hypothetical protein